MTAATKLEPIIGEAIGFGAVGLHVFPVRDKKPAIPRKKGGRGFRDASTDRNRIVELFADFPGAGIGFATGEPQGFFVVDLDEKHGGPALYEVLQQEHGDDGCAVIVSTPGGGQHRYFRWPAGRDVPSRVAVWHGIDFRGDGAYVVGPSCNDPGREFLGETFEDVEDFREQLTEAPEWLLEAVAPDRSKPADMRVGGGNSAHAIPLPGWKVAEIKAALQFIDADGYETWRNVGMALKSTAAGQQAFDIWDEWSRTTKVGNYDPHDQVRHWDSYREFLWNGKEITIATLFHYARSEGWDNTYEAPKEPEQFSQVFAVGDEDSRKRTEALGAPVVLADESDPMKWARDRDVVVIPSNDDRARVRAEGIAALARNARARNVEVCDLWKDADAHEVPNGWTIGKELERRGEGAVALLRGIAERFGTGGNGHGARVRSYADFMQQPDFRFRMAGWLPTQGIAALGAMEHTGKSVLAVDWAHRCLFGDTVAPWCGHEVRVPCSSVYIVGEDAQGIALRSQAWRREALAGHLAEDFDGFHEGRTIEFVDRMPSPLCEPVGIAEVERIVCDFEERNGHKPGLVFLDTSSTLYGGDENDNAAMGQFAKALAEVAEKHALLVVLVHHLRKPAAAARGAQKPGSGELRGASAMAGNFDTVLLVWRKDDSDRTSPVEVFIHKGKNGGTTGASHYLRSELVTLRQNEDGDDVVAPVLLPTERPVTETEEGRHEVKMANVERIAFRMVAELRDNAASPEWVGGQTDAETLTHGKGADKRKAWKWLVRNEWVTNAGTERKPRWQVSDKAPPSLDPRFTAAEDA